MYELTVSVVTYDICSLLPKLLESCLKTNLRIKLYLVNNSANDCVKKFCNDPRIQYIASGRNIGYGAGNNIAIKKAMNNTKYHLVVNPDICFPVGTLERLFSFMEENSNIGLVMPSIINLDGTLQYLCKLLPSPIDLFCRRFIPVSNLKDKRNYNYELRYTNYNKIMDVSCLSGCFMFIRADVFKKVGLFDERYFMYMEDVDLTRRIHKYYRTVFYPYSYVYHENKKGSYYSYKLLFHHIMAVIKYFNKWGWLIDKERKKINKKIIENINGQFL